MAIPQILDRRDVLLNAKEDAVEGYLSSFVGLTIVLIIVALAVVWGACTLRGWLSGRPRQRPQARRTPGLRSGRYLAPPGGSWMHPIGGNQS